MVRGAAGVQVSGRREAWVFEFVEMLLKGALAGFVIAAPVGPVGVLCVQRTLSEGRVTGLVAGLGATLADGAYGCVAAFGLSLIANWLQSHEQAFRLLGGLLLLGMAVRMLWRQPESPVPAAPSSAEGRFRTFASTFLLTITNPITIVAFLGIFAFLGIGSAGIQLFPAMFLVAGVCLGSAVWWLSLAGLAGRFRARLEAGGMAAVNRLSGLLLLGFGIYGVGSVIWAWGIR